MMVWFSGPLKLRSCLDKMGAIHLLLYGDDLQQLESIRGKVEYRERSKGKGVMYKIISSNRMASWSREG